MVPVLVEGLPVGVEGLLSFLGLERDAGLVPFARVAPFPDPSALAVAAEPGEQFGPLGLGQRSAPERAPERLIGQGGFLEPPVDVGQRMVGVVVVGVGVADPFPGSLGADVVTCSFRGLGHRAQRRLLKPESHHLIRDQPQFSRSPGLACLFDILVQGARKA